MENPSLYDRLGLPPDASQDEIRHAYRQLVLHLHPDTNVNKGETALFIDIQQAYDLLADPTRKADYDHQLSLVRGQTSPVNIRTLFSRSSLVRLNEPQLIYSLVELSLPPDSSLLVSSIPLNISLVVDCSTSMQGIRLDTVKLTAIELIRQLQPNDVFSLVKFNDKAELLIPAGHLSDIKSAEMKIQLLQAGGGTEIYQGLEMGFAQVNHFLSTDHVNQIILITDGRTYGDEQACDDLARQAAECGVGISALGIGSKWNDVFLDNITSKTGGICRYISEITEIRNSILNEISRLGSCLTEQIIYNFSVPDYVELRSAFRLQPDAAPMIMEIPLKIGIMPRQGRVNFLMEFLINDIPADLDQLTLAKGFLNYRVPRDPVKSMHVQRLELSRKVSLTPDSQPTPQPILDGITILSLYRMQERARAEVAKGDLRSATRHLELMATHLLTKGENELAKSVMSEVKFIQNNQSFSEDGEKRIKYGTRALLLPANAEEKNT